jgi:hypothetical protein
MAIDEFGIANDEGEFQRRLHEHYKDLVAKEHDYWRRMIDRIEVREIGEYGGIHFVRPVLRTYCDGEKIVVTI